jgi:hypothetical protein
MSTKNVIRLSNEPGYRKYLNTQFPQRQPPWWQRLLPPSSVDPSLDTKIGGIPFKLKFGDITKNLFTDRKFEYAAREWLTPEASLEDLNRIQVKSGLSHIDKISFTKEVASIYKNWIGKHSLIEDWLWKKITLLEYIYDPPSPLSNELLEASLRLRIIQRELLLGNWQENPHLEVDKLLNQALKSACLLTNEILNSGKEGCELSANLMIPFENCNEYYSMISEFADENESLSQKEVVQGNWHKARTLWEPCEHTGKILGIVAEILNETESFRGFWVPVIRTPETNKPLPGAPDAYLTRVARSIFRDDLPLSLLDEFSRDLCDNWQNYMAKSFTADLFVSIPFFLKEDRYGGQRVYAILNVNARVQDKGEWRRACHETWLRAVRDQVAPLTCEAYLAYQLRYQVLFEEDS